MFASVLEQPHVIGALVAAPIVYLGGLALGRWLKRRHLVPLGAMYHLLCAGLAIYLPLQAIRWGVPTSDPEAWQDRGLRYLSSTLLLLAITFALAIFRRFYWQRWFKHAHEVEAPKLLQQVFTFAGFTIALMLILNLRHGQQINALIAGSGIAAIVLGFAMQETLANIISGIALQVSKPFKVGDWLIVEKQRAEVVEMNWRSTRLRTNDDIYLDIPNKTVTSGMITNLSYPTKAHAQRIRVRFEQRVPPNTVREILRRSAMNAPGVLHHPPVKVFLVEFMDSAAVYEIKYSLEEAGRFNDIEDAIRTNIWYEAQRAKLVIPAPVQNVHIHRSTLGPREMRVDLAQLVRKQEIFTVLTDSQREMLASGARPLRFGRGEAIIRQGDEGSSMYFIIEGSAEVAVSDKGEEIQVAELFAGDAFGEMCLLTGERRTATVRARTDCEVWEVDRPVIAPLLKENPELARHLSELLARRKLATEGLIASHSPREVAESTQQEYAHNFLRRITALFEI